MERKKAEAVIEAILFTMGESVEVSRLAEVIEEDVKTTREIIKEMKDRLDGEERGISIIELEDAYQMCTKGEMYEYLLKIAKAPRKYVLTDALLETLSIVAYKQPITRLDVERIRGVNSDHEDWMHRDAPFYLEQPKNFCEASECVPLMSCPH